MKKSLTLVVAVYNAVTYLDFILTSLQRQTMENFEVIIADDGSGPEMTRFVQDASSRFPFPIKHLWQPDAGFRKNVMLNKAIGASQTDYLVFIDGDCVPHRKFLEDHFQNRNQKDVLCGRRVNFSKQITDQLTKKDIQSGQFERLSLQVLFDGLMARSSNLEDAVRIENKYLRRMLHWNRARILGCNFSVAKPLLEKINGFNEDYQAPGLGEDSDIAYRLELIGARLVTLRYLAVLFHLYHPATEVGEENKKLYDRVVISKEAFCSNGLRKAS